MSHIGIKNKNGNHVYKCDKCETIFDFREDESLTNQGLFTCRHDHDICAWCIVGEPPFDSNYDDIDDMLEDFPILSDLLDQAERIPYEIDCQHCAICKEIWRKK